ncbi:MAG TPA: TonB family protein [Terriglobales bacterium]|nr:TonB family protein [Terriglobales bacterium]
MMRASRHGSLLLALLLLLSRAWADETSRGPNSPPASGPPVTIEYANARPEVIKARLERVSYGNARRKAALRALFEESGCSARIAEQEVEKSSLPNVICTLGGANDLMIVVGAHYDVVEIGKGVVDNWSGASLLPTLYESLRHRPRRHTFVFIGFTDEEKGLVGSKFYVSRLSAEEKRKVLAMINLDTLGLSPTKIWLSHGDKALAGALNLVARATELPLAVVNVDNVGSTDSESFAGHGIRALTIHSLTQETLPILHSPQDQMSALRFEDYYDSYRLVAAYLAFLDAQLGSAASDTPAHPPASQAIAPSQPGRVTLSADAAQSNALDQPPPQYPELARIARIQGAVVVSMLIGTDGKVKETKLVTGHPTLAPAALSAVRNWRYRPYQVNGTPVEVETQVTVEFQP